MTRRHRASRSEPSPGYLHRISQPRPLPKISAPATKALGEIGVRDLNDVRRVGLDNLVTLHGVGPKAIHTPRAALEEESTA